jgi:hypothetical protein
VCVCVCVCVCVVVLGGLVVILLAIGPKVRGCNPAEDNGFSSSYGSTAQYGPWPPLLWVS